MTLYVLQEQSDVFVDACASDHHAQLLFVSVYGRDTSIQQLMARLHQPTNQGGVEALSLLNQHGAKPAMKVLVGDAKRLTKVAGRMPKSGLLGNLVHTWIFDPKLQAIDHGARTAWIFTRSGSDVEREAQAWRLIKELSPVPLLDSWADWVLNQVRATGGFTNPPVVGPIETLRIELHEDFPIWVSEAVASDTLRAPGGEIKAKLLPSSTLTCLASTTASTTAPATAA
jgi:hypothetical protein